MSVSNSQFGLGKKRGRLALAVAALTVAAWGCTTNVRINDVGSTIAQGGQGARTGAVGTGKTREDGAEVISPADVPGLKPQSPAKPPQPADGAVTLPGDAPVAPAPGVAPAAPEAPLLVDALPNSPWKNVPVSDKPFVPATPLVAPVSWPRSQVVVPEEVTKSATFRDGGEGVVMGRIVDKQGKAAAGVPIFTEVEQTTTNEDGWYRLRIKAAPDARIRVGGNEAGYVPQDWNIGVFPEEQVLFHNEVLRLDTARTRINLAQGGQAKSSPLDQVMGVGAPSPSGTNPLRAFGLFQAEEPTAAVYMEVPPGALEFPGGKTETDVVLTWLDPLPRDGKPYGDLYGPLQSFTAWDAAAQSGVVKDEIAPFNPVNFADLDLGGARIKPGGEVKVKWVVGKEVEKRYPITLQNGQAFFPCYQYESGWVKPVLATVFFEKGYYWATYTMRGSNSPAVVR